MREISSKQDFENAIQGCVVVEFYADWCGPCKQMAPALRDANAEVVKVDVDEFSSIAQEYGIRSIPTLMAFRNGKSVNHTVGSVPKAEVESLYQPCA